MPSATEQYEEPGDALREVLVTVDMQRSLRHPNIAPVLDVFVDPESLEVSFVMNLASGGSVGRFLAHHPELTEAATAAIVRKMLLAVRYCHEQHVCHRDIKLDNFVFESEASDAEVLLIDFGMAVLSPPGEMIEDGCSTLLYMAPEMFYLWHAHVAKTGGSVLYDHKVDVWALGVTIFQMLVGVLPFGLGDDPAEDEEETADRIVYEPLAYPDDAHVSDAARAFLARLLQRDPEERPTVKEALGDPWLAADETERDGADGAAESTVELRRGLADSLKQFTEVDVLKRAAYHALAQHATVTDAPRLRELRKAFAQLDADGSGTISKAELVTALRDFPELAALDVDALYAALASGEPGAEAALDWKWFLAATLRPAPAKARASKAGGSRDGAASSAAQSANPGLVDAFLELDRDNDGLIDAHDVLRALRADAAASSDLDEAAVRELLRHASGAPPDEPEPTVSLHAFRALMLGDSDEAQQLSATLNGATRGGTRWRRVAGHLSAVSALTSGAPTGGG